MSRPMSRDRARSNGIHLGGYTLSMRTPNLLILVALALACPLGAQAPAERDSIADFRERLTTVDDSLILLQQEAELIEVARADRDNAMLHVLLGWVAYRLGEITEGNQHYDDAAGEFEWAAELEPEWPYPWYGLGLAELAMGEHSIIAIENLRQMLGQDYLSKAAGAFARAAAIDPTFTQAVLDLAETAMTQRVRPRLAVALGALREVGPLETTEQTALLLARGRLELRIGEADSAVAAFTRYLEVGADSGLGYLELARSYYLTGRSRDGEGSYYLGGRLARSAEAVAAYREDIAWVATPAELDAFDRQSSDQRGAWLRAFWRGRDAGDVRIPGERLREHHRRYFYAIESYPLLSRHRQYDVVNPYRSSQELVDDRGVIYVRHGEPDQVALFPALGVDPNVSWLYVRSGGNLVFHFAARGDVGDYKLIESLLDVFGPDTALRVQTGQWPLSTDPTDPRSRLFLDLFNSRQNIDAQYQRLATGAGVQQTLLAEERSLGGRSVVIGTRTDSYPIRFRAELEAALQRHVVAGESGSEVLVVYSVPGSALEPEQTASGVVYRLELRTVLLDGATRVAYSDTTRVVRRDRELEDDEYLHGYMSVPVPDGLYELKVVLADRTRGAGRIAADDAVVVPNFLAPVFGMSDVVVGQGGAGEIWRVRDDSLSVTARRRLPSDRPLEVYYEVHGLGPGTRYRSELEVRKIGGGSVFGWVKRLFGGSDAPVALELEGVAVGPTTRVLQTVDVGDLAEGRYRLTIRIRPDGGADPVEREVDLTLVGT
jgi:tetratricopeptide (TPR) repeat protein